MKISSTPLNTNPSNEIEKLSFLETSSKSLHPTIDHTDAPSRLIEAMERKDENKLRNIFKELPINTAKKITSQAHRHRFHSYLDDKHFFFIKSILDFFPEKATYFTLLQEPEGSGHPHRTILSPEGVQKILDYLTQQGKISDKIPCTVHPDYCTFSAGIRKITSYSQTSTMRQGYFLVRHTDPSVPNKYHVHFSSVFIKISPEFGVESFISDSNAAAHDEINNADGTGKYFPFRLAKVISEVFPEAIFYTNLEGRQSDRSNCPVFSILDTIQLQKIGDIFSLARKIGCKKIKNSEFDSNIVMQALISLPTGMMKTAQSLTKLNQYKDSIKNEDEKAKLDASLQKHTESVDYRKVNTRVAKKYIKYERFILETT